MANEVFVEGNVALARAHIDEEFLSYWAIIDAAFTKFDGDVEYLVQDLCEKWDIAKNELDKHTPAIIAIMTGYPMGRLGRKFARRQIYLSAMVISAPASAC